MSDHSSVICRIADLEARFVESARFVPLQQRFTMLVQKRLADIAACRTKEALGLALIGESGTGKSCAVAQLIRQLRSAHGEQTIDDSAIISLRVPSPATLKFLGQTILRALGYQLDKERQAWYIWDLVRFQLREQQVLFLHLDEAQDLSSRGTKHELNAVASMLKTLMTDDEWPVGLLLSGTPELEAILNHDPQLARRMRIVRFDPLSAIGDVDNVLGLVAGYAARGALSLGQEVSKAAFAERLIHAAAFQFGLSIKLVIAAIEMAFLERATILRRAHFAAAFEAQTACNDAFNPFIVDDYHHIDARRVCAKLGDNHGGS